MMRQNYFSFDKKSEEYLLTNEEGYYIFLSEEDFKHFIEEQYDALPADILNELIDKFFIFDEDQEVFIERTIPHYRDMKSYTLSSTSLHIFVLTDRCNLTCRYCQAGAISGNCLHGHMMSRETARKAVDVAVSSPAKSLSFEFQGGEPLINFDALRFIVEYSQKICNDKRIDYSLVTNSLLLNNEIIDFIRTYKISVSVSLDGPGYVHDFNRPAASGQGSYKQAAAGIQKLIAERIPVGAIETTTRYSLPYSEQIVDTYVSLGLNNIFIRPLTPLGYAKEQWNELGYSAKEFLHFYQTALEHIIQVNKKGVYLSEGHAKFFLTKILKQFSENYMELRSPCGASVGQLAYNYDGNIYTCDEARMLAQMGRKTFLVGNVQTDNYDALMSSRTCMITCQSSVLEGIPECCDCVYHPYCGTCPVVNFALYGNIYAREPNHYRCQIYKGMLDIIFHYLRDGEAVRIFQSWVQG